METLPLAEAKARLSDLISQVQLQHDHVTVTRNGYAAAVVVSMEEWESLHETLEILSDSETVAAIGRARAEVERGDVHTTRKSSPRSRKLGSARRERPIRRALVRLARRTVAEELPETVAAAVLERPYHVA